MLGPGAWGPTEHKLISRALDGWTQSGLCSSGFWEPAPSGTHPHCLAPPSSHTGPASLSLFLFPHGREAQGGCRSQPGPWSWSASFPLICQLGRRAGGRVPLRPHSGFLSHVTDVSRGKNAALGMLQRGEAGSKADSWHSQPGWAASFKETPVEAGCSGLALGTPPLPLFSSPKLCGFSLSASPSPLPEVSCLFGDSTEAGWGSVP